MDRKTGAVEGLTNAFTVRATIQQAIGIIVAGQHSTPDRAYATLRLRAADAGVPLPDLPNTIVAGEPA